MTDVQILSIYDGMFSGGARYLHTDIVVGFSERSIPQAVLSINSITEREHVIQRMEHDQSFLRLSAAGVKVTTLGRRSGYEPDRTRFTEAELAVFTGAARRAKLIFSVKEQPLRLVNQASGRLPPVVVGLHRSDPEHQGAALKDLLCAVKHGLVQLLIATSQSARTAYAGAGVPEALISCVHNAINLSRFTLDDAAARRAAMRAENNIEAHVPVIVLAARYDAMKDIGLFLRAAHCYLSARPEARIILCGAGMMPGNLNLQDEMTDAFGADRELLERLTLLGVRHDMEMIYSMADVVACTSAYGETYPLALMEGLACGAIPVATQVGDTADIVGAGRGILTSRDPAQIADAWLSAHIHRAGHLGHIASTRHKFDRSVMLDRYQHVLRPLLGAQSA